jgi:hypothetical protein
MEFMLAGICRKIEFLLAAIWSFFMEFLLAGIWRKIEFLLAGIW